MKNKFSSKPITIGLCIYIVGFILFTIFNYIFETKNSIRDIDIKLENGARSIPLLVGAENMQQLLLGEIDEEVYINLVRTLSDYADMHGFGYLYVLQDNGRDIVNIVTSATTEEWQNMDFQMNGDIFSGAMEFMRLSMETGQIWHDELADEWGHFRSIYVPFYGPNGHPYILAADMEISVIRAMQRRSLLNSVFTGVLFLLFASPLILLTARDMREQRNKLAKEVETQTAHISVLNADLQKQLAEVAEKAALSRSALEQAEQAKAEAEQARREGSIAAANKIERAVTDISSTLQVLAQKIVEAEHGAATQANMITHTSHQMELINSSITDVARNAQTASELSQQASGQADNSAATARSAVASMLQVNRETSELRDNMSALGGHSQAIVQIMSIISDIADQTNLLALNAAIEAARAGDAGRGFAVVADEVRKLAERTMVSTGEVGKVVEAVRQGSQRSLEQTEVAIQAVASAEKLVEESGTSLNHIREVMEQAADEVQSIAVAANQQSTSSTNISQAMREINSISGRTSSLMSEADSALTKLSAQAEILAKVVEELKKG